MPVEKSEKVIDEAMEESAQKVQADTPKILIDRWVIKEHRNAKNEKIDAFLNDVIEVCKRHGFSIGHEDNHGGFIVEKFSNGNADWLMCASDDT